MKTMKMIKQLIGAAALVATTNSWGYTINSGATNVGLLDGLLGIAQLANAGQQTETDWVNSLVDPNTTFNTKTETVSYSLVDGQTSIYAFSLQNDPGWYIIKNATWWALYQNVASTDWAVFNDSALPDGMNLGGTGQLTISHVTEFGTAACPGCTPDEQSVPEPSSLGLLAAGILGLAAARRFIRKA